MRYFGMIQYEEGKQTSYKGIVVFEPITKDTQNFGSGNPVIDLIDLYQFLADKEADEKNDASLSWDESYDNFFEHGNKYTWCRVHNETEKIYLTDKDLEKDYNLDNKEYLEETTEYIIPSKMKLKDFEQLIKYYQRHKK